MSSLSHPVSQPSRSRSAAADAGREFDGGWGTRKLSNPDLAERLSDVTALAVTQAACRRAPVSPAVTLRPAGNEAPSTAAAHQRRH